MISSCILMTRHEHSLGLYLVYAFTSSRAMVRLSTFLAQETKTNDSLHVKRPHNENVVRCPGLKILLEFVM